MIIFKLKQQYCVFSLSDCKKKTTTTTTHWGYSMSGFKILNIYLSYVCIVLHLMQGSGARILLKQRYAFVIPHFRLTWKLFLQTGRRKMCCSTWSINKMYMKELPFEEQADLLSPLCSKYKWEYACNNIQWITLSASRCNKMHTWVWLSFFWSFFFLWFFQTCNEVIMYFVHEVEFSLSRFRCFLDSFFM